MNERLEKFVTGVVFTLMILCLTDGLIILTAFAYRLLTK
jgi:hypothetical protein